MAAGADQFSGAGLPPCSGDVARGVAEALRGVRSAVRLVCGREHDDVEEDAAEGPRVDPRALAAICSLDDIVSLYEEALHTDPARVGAYDAAVLVWCLARPALRDVALVQWATDRHGGERALDAQHRWEEGAEYPTDVAMTMWGEGVHPDPERLRRALEVARRTAAVAPEPQRPGPLSMCAWLSWALGRSTHADRYARMALDIEPDHGLSEIVLSFVGAAHLPDWAFRRRRASS